MSKNYNNQRGNVLIVLLILLLIGSASLFTMYKTKMVSNKVVESTKVEPANDTMTTGNDDQKELTDTTNSKDCDNLYSLNTQTWKSESDGYCLVRNNLQWDTTLGYQIMYPKSWTYTLRGTQGTGMSFEEDGNELVFIGFSKVDYYPITLDSYQNNVISPDDKILKQANITIDNRSFIELTTKSKLSESTYYLYSEKVGKDVSLYGIRINNSVNKDVQKTIMSSFKTFNTVN